MLKADNFNENLPAVIIKFLFRNYLVDSPCPPGYQQDQPAVLQDVQRPPPRRPEVQVNEKIGWANLDRCAATQTRGLLGGQVWRPQ